MIETLIFDLDNTLYRADSRLFDQIDQKMTAYVAQRFRMPAAQARVLQKQYFHTYGTTLSGLMRHHGTDPHDFLEFVHDIDLSGIGPDPVLAAFLAGWRGRSVIYTNGTLAHARKVLARLGLEAYFTDIFDIHQSHYRPKPEAAPFAEMVTHYRINPQGAVFFDDIPRNLPPAAKLGMTTVWIESAEYESLAPDADEAHHIHHTAETVHQGLRMLGLMP